MRFLDFVREKYEPGLPKVLFGISKDHLEEALSVEHYDDFIGLPHQTPEAHGFVRQYKGLYGHPNHPGKTFFFPNSHEPQVFNDDHDAMNAMDMHNAEKRKRLEDLSNVLENHYHHSKYSNTDKDAIHSYTHYNSTINTRLLGGNLEAPHEHFISKFDKTLARKNTPDELHVYTGTNTEHGKILQNNEVVHHPSYLSTSLSINRALNFARDKGGDMVKIHVPAGHPGLYAGSMSMLPREREFILPRDTKLRIDHSKRQIISYDLAKRPVILHHAYIQE